MKNLTKLTALTLTAALALTACGSSAASRITASSRQKTRLARMSVFLLLSFLLSGQQQNQQQRYELMDRSHMGSPFCRHHSRIREKSKYPADF